MTRRNGTILSKSKSVDPPLFFYDLMSKRGKAHFDLRGSITGDCIARDYGEAKLTACVMRSSVIASHKSLCWRNFTCALGRQHVAGRHYFINLLWYRRPKPVPNRLPSSLLDEPKDRKDSMAFDLESKRAGRWFIPLTRAWPALAHANWIYRYNLNS